METFVRVTAASDAFDLDAASDTFDQEVEHNPRPEASAAAVEEYTAGRYAAVLVTENVDTFVPVTAVITISDVFDKHVSSDTFNRNVEPKLRLKVIVAAVENILSVGGR